MTKRYVVCLGEILIDFTSAGLREGGGPLFEQNAGGAPANVACGLSRLGVQSYFIGKVGTDMFGRFLRETLRKEGVSDEYLFVDDGACTTVAFVSLQENGEREFAFLRNPGADTLLRYSEVPQALLRQAAVFHFGTLSLTHQPSANTLMQAVMFAREQGVVTSLDVNLRPALWPSLSEAHQRLHRLLPLCDMVKMSAEELFFACEGQLAEAGTESRDSGELRALALGILSRYPEVLVLNVTHGSSGAIAYYRDKPWGQVKTIYSRGFSVAAVDTTGAGDAFTAGFLLHVVEHGLVALLEEREKLEAALRYANACGASCVTRRGAIAAMPYHSNVLDIL